MQSGEESARETEGNSGSDDPQSADIEGRHGGGGNDKIPKMESGCDKSPLTEQGTCSAYRCATCHSRSFCLIP